MLECQFIYSLVETVAIDSNNIDTPLKGFIDIIERR